VTISYCRKRADGRENLPSSFAAELGGEISHLNVSDHEKESLLDPLARYRERKNFGPRAGDKDYVRELFESQGLSVTALNNYLRCTWQYFYVNLLRIPTAILPHQLYGTAVHASLRELFEALKTGKKIDKKGFLKMFEIDLSREPLSKHEFEIALKRGKAALGGYYDAHKSAWNTNVLTEFGIKGVEVAGVRLSGRLDKVELLDEKGNVNVVDYKTGKPKSRNDIEGNTKSSEGDIKRQLVFYKLILNRFADGRYKMQSGEIDFVEPNERDYYKKEKFEVSNLEVVELEEVIKRVGDEIRSLAFFDRRCDEPKCDWCKLRAMMGKQ
jgi:DNA helicase-2/ATP-dependent DNA helicase PcrA